MDLRLIAALVGYPGVVFTLLLAVALWWLLHRNLPVGNLRALLVSGGVVPRVVALLSIAAMLVLPWPLHPLTGQAWLGAPLLLFGALEAAYLAPLLRELTADEGARVRAASREAQLGAAGRLVVYLAVAGVPLLPSTGIADVLGRLLLALAATLTLPVALGWGAFGPERSISPAAEPGAAQQGANALRSAATIATVALLWVPPTLFGLPALALALCVALIVALALALRAFDGRVPRQTLPAALRLCWVLALPVALLGVACLALRG
jgi:hypothetical protein